MIKLKEDLEIKKEMQHSKSKNIKATRLEQIAEQLQAEKNLTVTDISPKGGLFSNIMYANDGSQDLTIKIISISNIPGIICEALLAEAIEEAQMLKECQHPNIITYHSDFQIGNNYFIVMEKCEISLQDLVDHNKDNIINKQIFISFAIQILGAVDYLHSKGYVFKDLTLKNILLDSNEDIKLYDFGLVKQIEEQKDHLTYLSSNINGQISDKPNQTLKQKQKVQNINQTKEANILATGKCLYALTGASFQDKMFINWENQNYIPQEHLGQEINQILVQLLQRNQTDRPQIQQVIEQFQKLIEEDEDCDDDVKQEEEDDDDDEQEGDEENGQEGEEENEDDSDNEDQQSNSDIEIEKNAPISQRGNVTFINLSTLESQSYYRTGLSYYGQGMVEEAIYQLVKAVQLDPNNDEIHYNLGVFYQDLAKNDQALKCYKNVLILKPKNSSAHFNIGLIYFRKDMYKEAKESYYKAIKYNPSHFKTYLQLGQLYQKLSKYENAYRCTYQAIKIQPNFEQAFINLGHLYRDQSKYEDSLKCFKKGLEINPRNQGFHVDIKDLKSKI